MMMITPTIYLKSCWLELNPLGFHRIANEVFIACN
jgi:hypothetical protein